MIILFNSRVCDRMEGFMASFKKFLAGTAITAAAVAGGIAVYKKLQENKSNADDDFDDLDIENRNYTVLPSDAVVATEEDAEEDSTTK